jgi:hypothetical protein
MRRIIAFVTGPIVGSYLNFRSSKSFKSSVVGANPVVCRPFFAFDFAITIHKLRPWHTVVNNYFKFICCLAY